VEIFGLCFFQDKNHFLNLESKTFKEQLIRDFLNEKGIGIFDTAYQVIRLKGNASDKFLQILSANRYCEAAYKNAELPQYYDDGRQGD
jgi:G:T/U mismatch-specific DNA glycosylase